MRWKSKILRGFGLEMEGFKSNLMEGNGAVAKLFGFTNKIIDNLLNIHQKKNEPACFRENKSNKMFNFLIFIGFRL